MWGKVCLGSLLAVGSGLWMEASIFTVDWRKGLGLEFYLLLRVVLEDTGKSRFFCENLLTLIIFYII